MMPCKFAPQLTALHRGWWEKSRRIQKVFLCEVCMFCPCWCAFPPVLRFLPQSKDMQDRRTEDTKQSVSVCESSAPYKVHVKQWFGEWKSEENLSLKIHRSSFSGHMIASQSEKSRRWSCERNQWSRFRIEVNDGVMNGSQTPERGARVRLPLSQTRQITLEKERVRLNAVHLTGLCVHDNKEHEWRCHVIGPYRGQHVSCVALEDRRSAATRSWVMCPSDPR